MMDVRGKRVVVAGLGASGGAAARLLAERGARLVLSDRSDAIDIRGLPQGELRLGSEDPRALDGADLVVVSPGVPPSAPMLREADRRRIPIIGEIELAAAIIEAPIVAITGTNGKSTVTVLAGEMFKAAGYRTFVGGNLGQPLSEAVACRPEVAVAEVSSFQLERIVRFKPRVGVYLNLTEDHLDRYRDLAEYGRAKARLFANQDTNDFALLSRDDPNVWALAPSLRARVTGFGMTPDPRLARCLWLAGDRILWRDGEREMSVDLSGYRPGGRHNRINAMAAAGAALVLGVGEAPIERALREFRPLPHRMEFVAERQGVTYIDDSKVTNVGAVCEALAALSGRVILIAGGTDKGGDYAPLKPSFADKVRLLLLIGAARDRMHEALEGTTAIELLLDLKEAVQRAARVAQPGDTVLLSPACSSFDQFRNYAERGKVFQELVRAL